MSSRFQLQLSGSSSPYSESTSSNAQSPRILTLRPRTPVSAFPTIENTPSPQSVSPSTKSVSSSTKSRSTKSRSTRSPSPRSMYSKSRSSQSRSTRSPSTRSIYSKIRSPQSRSTRSRSARSKLSYAQSPKKRKVFEFSKWMKESRKNWMTIANIKKLDVGKKLQAVILSNPDRTKLRSNRSYRPSHIFKYFEVELERENLHTIRCIIKYKYGGTVISGFDFDIENDGKWLTIINGKVHYKSQNPMDDRVIDWTDLPETTPIAIFGQPLILLKNIDKFSTFFKS